MTPEVSHLLAGLTALARLGAAMRKAQRRYFEQKKLFPGVSPTAEYRAARDLERRFDAAVEDALNRDRQQLPGMEGGGS